ncbi:MAG: substrate-binding domain-containing protein [Rhizobiales bacterium]|nr:substrate-binding domain-containing protein [Hyphomicrobiales bacterium]
MVYGRGLRKRIYLLAACLCGFLALNSRTAFANDFILVQSTTSTRDSGLYDYLLPKFETVSGIDVRVVSVGTGQAIRNAFDCNGDVLLVHSKQDEEEFVREGYGLKRHDLMYNDFVIIGPKKDPAKLSKIKGVKKALTQLAKMGADSGTYFASRGDDSGTNKAELRLWKDANIDVQSASGKWYLETGSGMGKTLAFAVGKNAYTLSDRATWVKYGNKANHEIIVQDEPPMFNQYGVTVVSADKCPNVKSAQAKQFVNWLISKEGQSLIGSYRVEGQQMFFPNAKH